MAEIYKGRGKKEDEKKLIEMLDNVFFLEDDEATKRDFLSLLPKLYKSRYEPAYNNFTVMEDGEFKGAVGLYPSTASACGKKLKIGGIGNVAVSRDARRRGFMIECMNMCLDQMKNDGTAYSLLGGHRQRYGYFGYEPAGSCCDFDIDRRNIAHVCGKDFACTFTVKEVAPEDTDTLAKINELYKKQPFYIERADDELYDILCSWDNRPYAAFKDGVFKGYFTLGKYGGMNEFKPADISDTIELILGALDTMGKDSIGFTVPHFDTEMCEYMAKVCGGYDTDHCEMVNIFRFADFIEAFLKVKASRMPLCDGSLVLLIHGIRCDEKILITVRDNRVSVEPTELPADAELEHNEAVRAVASMYSGARLKFPAFAQTWFPVDFFSYSQDNV